MNELTKTVSYVVVAIVLAVVAFVSRPRQPEFKIQQQVGKPLFPDFDDPRFAASLEVVRFDDKLGELHTFKVAKETGSGRWVIPSHSNYPADAENQMRDAATALIDLKVLDIASEQAGDHSAFGVIEPDKEKLKVGDEGVGLKVAIEDKKGKNLARLIIGGKVKGKEDQRFVRISGQNPIYVAKIDPEKLSTKFENWIEKDLLKLSSWDIKQIKLKDYSVVQSDRGPFLDRRFDLLLTYDDKDYKWKLDEMLTYQRGKGAKTTLGDDEELNSDRINDLKNALGDLKIVDVRRKPKGLGADLKAERGFMSDRDNVNSLGGRGFYIDPNGLDLWAANGDMQVSTKEGVQYLLRFGNIAGAETAGEESKVNRYLFVTARLDESQIPPPELEKVPAAESEDKEAAPKPPEKQAPAASDKKTPAPEEKPAAKKTTGKTEDKKAGETEKDPPGEGARDDDKTTEKKSETPKQDQRKAKAKDAGDKKQPKDAANKEAAKKEVEGEKEQAKEAGGKKQEKDASTKQTSEESKKEAEKAEKKEQPKTSDAERERILKDNKRKQDEYDEKVKKAKDKVKELNSRFSDWYYVISEDVYKKIHLGRADVIKESDKAKEEGFGVDSFRKMEKEGLKTKEEKEKAKEKEKDKAKT